MKVPNSTLTLDEAAKVQLAYMIDHQLRSRKVGAVPDLFIDELHTLRTGHAEQLDIANTMKPLLARGAIKVIGATTGEEYHQHILADSAWSDRFLRFEVKEPSRAATLEMLLAAMPAYAEFHGVEIDPSAAEAS